MGEPPVAVVTGASAGIGRACVDELRRTGWLVAGLDLRRGEHADLDLVVDVSDEAAVHAAVREVGAQLGRVTAVVSAAGHVEEVPIARVTEAAVHRMLAVHLGGLVHLCRAALPDMIGSGGGAVVAVASELALTGGDNASHYVMAKGALIGLIRSLAAELSDASVLVNAVAPGPTDTAMLGEGTIWRDPSYLDTLPARALVQPEEIAVTTAFLLSGQDALTGQVVSPNAGTAI